MSCSSNMPQADSTPAVAEAKPEPKMKICCACPETKTLRDDCIIRFGEEQCKVFIDDHLRCLRDLGFKV